MSRARLRDRHQSNLRRKLQLLKQEQGVQPAPRPHDAHRYACSSIRSTNNKGRRHSPASKLKCQWAGHIARRSDGQ